MEMPISTQRLKSRIETTKSISIYGWVYDHSIESLLKGIRKKVSHYILQHRLFPLLDICCGTGIQLSRSVKKKYSVFGLDLNLELLDYAASRFPHIPFICADASHVPIKGAFFKGIVISYALHEKTPQVRQKMAKEARRLLTPGGKIILIDYESPWSGKSQWGALLTYLIERIAGGDHFRNYQQFLREGGLRGWIIKENIVERERYEVELASSSIVVGQWKEKSSSLPHH